MMWKKLIKFWHLITRRGTEIRKSKVKIVKKVRWKKKAKTKFWEIFTQRILISKFRTRRYKKIQRLQIEIKADWKNVGTGEIRTLVSHSLLHRKFKLDKQDLKKLIREAVKQMELTGSWVLVRIRLVRIIRWTKRRRVKRRKRR